MRARIGWRALARYVAGESTPQEVAAIEAWAGADPRHAEILREVRQSWESAAIRGPEPDTSAAWRALAARLDAAKRLDAAARPDAATRLDAAAPVDAAPLGIAARLDPAAPAAGEHRTGEHRTGERPAGHRPGGARPVVAKPAARPGWRRAPGWAWGLAAAAVLALAALPVLRRGAADAGVSMFSTGAAQVRTVRLGDGSVVRLAPNTTLRAAPASRREAWLEGTAFFAIAKRNGVPFVVHTAGGDARVLGTRFELRTAVKTVRLAVLEGRVALSAPGGREVVEAGQVSEVEAGRAPTAPRAADVQTMVGWMRGVLIFEATPLRQAAREIERQYDVRVRLADPSLGDRTVSAVFDHQSLETVVATICRVTDATCQVEEGTVWVRP